MVLVTRSIESEIEGPYAVLSERVTWDILNYVRMAIEIEEVRLEVINVIYPQIQEPS